MTEKLIMVEELKQQLQAVEYQIQILDLIEERLTQMKQLAQRVAYEDLTEKEIQAINVQVKDLEEQVRLLQCNSTQLS